MHDLDGHDAAVRELAAVHLRDGRRRERRGLDALQPFDAAPELAFEQVADGRFVRRRARVAERREAVRVNPRRKVLQASHVLPKLAKEPAVPRREAV